MGFGKNELRLAIILAIVLYAFAFYKFVWTTTAPAIEDANARIQALEKEKIQLDEQLKNIDMKKTQLMAKNTLNERIDEFLMNSANLIDCLEYVDRLTSLVGENIAEMNIGRPEERYATRNNNPLKSDTDLNTKNQSRQPYYESRIDFRAYMTSERAMKLINYIESGTQKVKITKFSVKPLKDNKLPQAANLSAAKNTAAQGSGNEKLFEVNMTISLYSLNIRALDRMFEYNRYKLNRFMNTGGIMFGEMQLKSDKASDENFSLLDDVIGTEDIVIKEKSYLAAGENLQVFGVDREKDILMLKTDKPQDVSIRLDKNSYTISAKNSLNKLLQIDGPLPDKEIITMGIVVDMPDIEENKNIKLNLSITNNSGKKINIRIDDRQKRVKITDRNGKTVTGDNAAEHINII